MTRGAPSAPSFAPATDRIAPGGHDEQDAPPADAPVAVGRDQTQTETTPAPVNRLTDGSEVLWEGDGFLLKRMPDGELVRENAWEHLSLAELKHLSASEFGANAELFNRYLQSDAPGNWEHARTYGLRTIVMAPEHWRGDTASAFAEAMDYVHFTDAPKSQLIEAHRYAQLAERLGASRTYKEPVERELLALGEPLPPIDDLVAEINELSLKLTGSVLLTQPQR